MKLAALFLVAVAAVDTEAPVISLNLAYNGAYESRQPYKLTKRIVHTQASNHKGLPVKSYQDYSVRCTAGTVDNAANVKNCPRPTATAFDHHDGKIAVTERIFLMDMDGVPQNKQIPTKSWSNANYAKRSTYLFKYDATDASGNRADQVVFAMILDDLHAPEITYQGANQACTTKTSMIGSRKAKCFPVMANEQIIEAASSWQLPKETTAYDNIDGNVTNTLEYAIKCNSGDCGAGMHGLFRKPASNGWAACGGAAKDCMFSYNNARKLLDTKHVGKYTVVIRANDHAGIYGHNANDNIRQHTVSLVIKDQRAPVIQVQGTSPKNVECDKGAPVYGESPFLYSQDCKSGNGKQDFCSKGADVLDLLDTVALGGSITEVVTYSGFAKRGNAIGRGTTKLPICGGNSCKTPLPVNKVGFYKVHFNAQDNARNAADEMQRVVRVRDVTVPEIKLVGAVTVPMTDSKALKSTDKWGSFTSGVQCSDTCSTKVKITSTWSPKEYTPGAPGTYVQTFKCTDDENNSAEAARTYVIEDDAEPVLTPNGKDVMTIEANKDTEYTDAGATCSDYADGQIDHQVVVHGDVVNARVPGTYTIKYDCKDSSGNESPTATRKIVVVDTECPYLRLIGSSTRTIEAGFPYKDQGATATDTLDGDLTKKIATSGGPNANHFVTERSCEQIRDSSNTGFKAKSGTYNILTTVKGKHEFQQVYCDMNKKFQPALTLFIHRGHKVINGNIQTKEMIVPYQSNQGACNAYGMTMAKFTPEEADRAIKYAKNIDAGHCKACVEGAAKVNGLFAFKVGQKTTDYFCSPKPTEQKIVDKKVNGQHHYGANAADLNVAEPGTFVMTFKVHDAAGNGAGKFGVNGKTVCTKRSMKTRTVVVKDTLPPVITLFLKNKLIQRSNGGKKFNPASSKQGNNEVGGNPFYDSYMAEQTTTVNGWLIAAAASAVAGVALMATSMKNTATTVPV